MDKTTIIPDYPEGVVLPEQGIFRRIDVTDWHPLDPTAGRIIDDATMPALVELTMDDGWIFSLWPDGTFVVSRDDTDTDTGWSGLIKPEGIRSNPYRT